MKNKLVGLVKEEKGQGLTEYGLVLGIIAVAVVGVIVALRGQILALFTNAQTSISNTGITGTEIPDTNDNTGGN
ncbi:Flp family type IVb pilin [Chengkuizengella sp. 2205SS18-9]|uniref:Flp family type IVb pilin n=1 Tax=Chengkuizengella axinellae TaxID=3064388 RepID=A0ABT9IYP8_9BACL|nr:Flp family type IVb pilin [Chengkuizengella sp. 2205SS18-9]MDP5274489.1 Flp family type IVb pilin [Chengkuizengella sp. 2205SS18-9]